MLQRSGTTKYTIRFGNGHRYGTSPEAGVHNITNAREAHSGEMRARMVNYSVSMGIRLACLILIFFVQGWLQWVLIAGAVFIPYFAVIIANGGGTNMMTSSDALLEHSPVPELEGPPTDPLSGTGPVLLQGEVVLEDTSGTPDQCPGPGR